MSPSPKSGAPAAAADDAARLIDALYTTLGGAGGVLGAALPPYPEITAISGGYLATFTNGRIYYSAVTGAHEVRAGPILNYYQAKGAQAGGLGFPTTGPSAAGSTGALVQRFRGGRVYSHSGAGTRAVTGVLLTKYVALGGSGSRLGLPTGDRFASGGATAQSFTGGRLYYTSTTGAQAVYGRTLARYLALGGPRGVLGPPTKSEYAGRKPGVRVTNFRHGRIWYTPSTGARDVRGGTLARYLAIGAETSRIGLPVTYRHATSFGSWQRFQHGYLKYYKARGKAYIRVGFTTSVRTPKASDIPYTYRAGCPVGPSSLRMIRVPFRSFSGDDQYGTIVVRSSAASDITRVFRSAHAAGWAIRRVRPVDVYGGSDVRAMAADNTSAFNCRKVTGNPYRLSQHSYGNAIDINTFENPYVTASRVYPTGARTYLDRSNKRKGMILRGDAVESTLRRLGWVWGGRWRYPDYQHFSANGR